MVCVLAGTRPTDEGQSNEEHNEENDLGSDRKAWRSGDPQLAGWPPPGLKPARPNHTLAGDALHH